MSDRAFPQINYLSLSGLAATLVGNGIGRFAYIALIPVIIQQAWFNRADAIWLGAATLLGYLLGAPLVPVLSRRVPIKTLLRVGMLICSLSYLVCAWQGGGFYWFAWWRTLAGVCGAILMVLAPYLVLSSNATKFRGRIGGIVFSGVGFGIVISGTVIPVIVSWGLPTIWLVLGSICFALTVLTWNSWVLTLGTQERNETQRDEPVTTSVRWPMVLLLAAYALNAIGYLPHTLFWVDFVVIELHYSFAVGGIFWAVFGMGAALGPFLTGPIADRFGFPKTLFFAFLLKGIGVALPLFDTSAFALALSSFLVGLFTPSIAGAVSSYAMKVVGLVQHRKYWARLTFSFASTQALVGFLMVFGIGSHESYRWLFIISATALLISAICITGICVCQAGMKMMLVAEKEEVLNREYRAPSLSKQEI